MIPAADAERALSRSSSGTSCDDSRVVVVAGAALVGLAAAAPVAAHGPVPAEPPTPANLLLGWTFPPLPTLAILAGTLWWVWAVGLLLIFS